MKRILFRDEIVLIIWRCDNIYFNLVD